MKKFLLTVLCLLSAPQFCHANPIDCAISYMSSLSSSTYGCVSCPSNPICTTITYANIGKTCGPTALADAQALLPGGWNSTSTTAVQNSCGVGNKIGIWIKMGTQTTEVRQCDSANNQPLNYQFTRTTYNYVVWCTATECNCDPTPDTKYCITRGYSCPSGAAVGLEFKECDVEGFPTGSAQFCGNAAIAEGILSGTIRGNIFNNADCGCDLDEQALEDMCAQIDPVESTCDDCSTRDGDNDGVNDCDDYCQDTPAGAPVSEYGCPVLDEDGDGVQNDRDACEGTQPGTQVDQWGCPIDQDLEVDNDGDGIPDAYDECPDSGGTVGPNGCPIDNPQPPPGEGDQDNDTGLLTGIISWLKSLAKKTDTTNDELNQIENDLEEINEKLDASGIDTTLPDDENFDGNLPEDFEAIDLESDFMRDFLSDLVQNNAFIQQISGTTLTASGACSLSTSVNIFGISIPVQLSLCEYDLTVFRAMILMIAALTGFFIVFRKG